MDGLQLLQAAVRADIQAFRVGAELAVGAE